MMFSLRLVVLLALGATGLANAGDDRNLVLSSTAPSATEKRIALVIGNSAYQSSPLKNPVNDAQDVAAKLKTLGFDVITRTNLTTRQIGGTLREFRSKLVPGAVALVFYAGHGLQIRGENYLPAIDADIASEEEVPNQSLSTRQIMDILGEAKTRLNLVFLDACRDNPFATRGYRSAAGGLAKVEAPSGTLISFATRPGSVAADGAGKNGLYTQYLLGAMDMADQPIEQALKQVIAGVKRESNGRQEPWMEGSIEGNFYFKWIGQDTSASSLGPGSTTRIKSDAEIEQELWDNIKDAGNADALNEYLKQYPKGRFAGQAKVLLAKLKKEYTTASTANRPPSENPESALWRAVEKGNSTDDYTAYLGQYPKGKYVALAKARLAKLRELAAVQDRQREEESWQAAEGNPSVEAYRSYLAAYPSGRYANLAKTRQTKSQLELDQKAGQETQHREQDAWLAAEKSDNLEGYKNYLFAYPKGRWAAEAANEIGNILSIGLNVSKDDRQAVEWYRKAADQGDVIAQYNLGQRYKFGRGVAKDESLAAEWFRKAIEPIRKGAEQGSARAQNALGAMYLSGDGVAKDEQQAAAWLGRAADKGYARAQVNLGAMYGSGQGFAKDERQAAEWYRKGAEHGNAQGQYTLGWAYDTGHGVSKDVYQAAQWFRKAAEQGFAPARFRLGQMYQFGLGVSKDESHAAELLHGSAEWVRITAEQGNAQWQINLAWMYEYGLGISKDEAEAVKWYGKAAEQGNALSQYNLGVMYASGRGVAKDEAEAVKWYRKAAEQGDAQGQYSLGLMYANGLGVPKSDEEAGKWVKKAAEQGNPAAGDTLGYMYQNGRGIGKDVAEAVKWYRKAAEQGNAEAQNNLGIMYETGQGIAKDEAEAEKWYRKAAEQGRANAQAALGRMMLFGIGAAMDDTQAITWIRKAAVQGNSNAMLNLGFMYARGRGVPTDQQEAIKWYRMAAEKGEPIAKQNLANLGLR